MSRVGGRSPGQALVELAIVVPLIVMMLLGLFDLGRGVFAYNTLAQAARQASRMAIVDQTTDHVRSAAVAYAPTLDLGTTDVDVCFKTEESTQQDCSSSTDDCPQAARVIGCLAIVDAHFVYQPMTPVISAIWSSISLSATSIQPVEYVCPSGSATSCP
jgi:Flp pilus assembly protein TadG